MFLIFVGPTLKPYVPVSERDRLTPPIYCNITSEGQEGDGEEADGDGEEDRCQSMLGAQSACVREADGVARCRCLPGFVRSRLTLTCISKRSRPIYR